MTHDDSRLSAPPHDKDVIVAAVAKHVLVAITSRHAKVAKICHRSHKYKSFAGSDVKGRVYDLQISDGCRMRKFKGKSIEAT